jgi:hypothetical protein
MGLPAYQQHAILGAAFTLSRKLLIPFGQLFASFQLLRRRTAPSGTRVNASVDSASLCSQECEHGTHECVRHGASSTESVPF